MPRIGIPSTSVIAPELDGDRIDASVAAAIIGMTTPQARRAAEQGLIPHWRVGRRLRFSRRALEQFIANGGTAAAMSSNAA